MTRIFTNTFYGECENQNIDVIESYNHIENIMYTYARSGFKDGFIKLHFAKGKFINHPISLRLSSIAEFFDISEDEINN